MAFIVEDGTGVADANSLASDTFADAYFADRNVTAWASLTTLQKTGALIGATDYIAMRFRDRFTGVVSAEGQSLPFPRVYNNVQPGVLPEGVKRACCEYAVRASVASLAPDLPIDETGRLFSKKTEEVGPIKESISYGASGSSSAPFIFRPYPVPDALMAGFLRAGGGLIRS